MKAIGGRRRQVAGRLPEDGAPARCDRNRRRDRARDRARERADRRLRLDLRGHDAALASTRASCSSARWSACLRRRWRRCPRSGVPCGCRCARRSQATGSAVGDQDAGDRLLRRVRFLPRTAQIGLRNVGRRRRRSLSTALVIAFAVGTLLAVLGLAAGISDTSRASWGDHGEDVRISSQGRRPLDAHAARLIRATPGVATIEPTFVTDVKLAGKDAIVWAVRQATMFHYRHQRRPLVHAGRGARRERASPSSNETSPAPPAPGSATSITVQTASGPVDAPRHRHLGQPAGERHRALRAADDDARAPARHRPPTPTTTGCARPHTTTRSIDRTTTRIEDTLTTHGYDVSSEIKYVRLANEIASYRTITTTLAVVGFLIVAISMAGLANALTMSVLERTREIGILRSIGARARDIRRIFATETIALAITGWMIAIPSATCSTASSSGWSRPSPTSTFRSPSRSDTSRWPSPARSARPARHAPAHPTRRPTTDPATHCATDRTETTSKAGRPRVVTTVTAVRRGVVFLSRPGASDGTRLPSCKRGVLCRAPAERSVARRDRRTKRVPEVLCPQAVIATALANACDGVIQPRVCRGRVLSERAMASSSRWVHCERSVDLGRYWRSSPLVFSLLPRCQGLFGSQK